MKELSRKYSYPDGQSRGKLPSLLSLSLEMGIGSGYGNKALRKTGL
jgi:hypothetical protein